jgi:hypothetical protein
MERFMTVKDLIKPIYDKNEFKKIKEKIYNLINSIEKESQKLNIDKLEKLINYWEDFDKKFDISKHRISDIEENGNKILQIIDKKIDVLDNFTALNTNSIDDIKTKLLFLKNEIIKHLHDQKIRYKQEISRRK